MRKFIMAGAVVLECATENMISISCELDQEIDNNPRYIVNGLFGVEEAQLKTR